VISNAAESGMPANSGYFAGNPAGRHSNLGMAERLAVEGLPVWRLDPSGVLVRMILAQVAGYCKENLPGIALQLAPTVDASTTGGGIVCAELPNVKCP
jgi:hypothetical protein